jgi:predicted Rossmann fold nucleotide-binding protein DprA/Smf involved in DNA uptake
MRHHQFHSLSVESNVFRRGFSSFIASWVRGTICALGNLEILQKSKLALFCSTRCPGELIIQAYEVAQTLRDGGVTVVGGFHSPVERDCMAYLLRGKQPLIICPARSIEAIKLPAEWKKGIDSGRLLLVSTFQGEKRATAKLAELRNRLLVALAEKVLVLHAASGGKTEALCREIAGKRSLLTLESNFNANLLRLGAIAIKTGDIPRIFEH